ncbi:sensor histidine kinase [Streptomyces sp. NBC_01483]|uniref:sensor histidine kinase n=1 Tax=Streptomyces sp. NBC_01483 TaxID=2903883 RepID=UPI002E30BCE2|nr:HAMP domain-containing sensor histidine kinase [Streptomyces sp. NBC_01483]
MTFRSRPASAFTGLFLVAGVALLAFVVVLARYGTAQQVRSIEVVAPVCDRAATEDVCPRVPMALTSVTSTSSSLMRLPADAIGLRLTDRTVRVVRDTVLQQLLLWSGIGLALIALLTGFMGWLLAGRALAPVAAMTDIARRISEQHLHERLALTGPDDELHRLASTFDSMLDRLEKSFESQRRFVANASHELRTPLAVQRTILEVGLADPLPEGLADIRQDLLAMNRDTEKLIASLLLLARSDLGLDEDETEESDLRDAAHQAVGKLLPQAEEKKVSLELAAEGPMPVIGDPVLLLHLVTNLVDNAVRYNRPGGTVWVRLTGRTLTITNTGTPVDPDRADGLFEPFRRLGQERTSTSVSIVASIAQAHAARVTARPRQGGGLTVSVTFTGT